MITILHLSDLHAKKQDELQLRIRCEKFIAYVEAEMLKPDLMVFSGDLAFSGQKEEYELAHRILLEPIRKRLQIPERRMIFVPGNHDVDRKSVEEVTNEGLQTICKDPEKASAYVANNPGPAARCSEYHSFISKKYNLPDALFYTKTFDIKGVVVGVACLNSAWLCSSDADRGRLHLTQQQVHASSDSLAAADLKIAVMHHPLDWYHPTEAVALQDLQRLFPIILTGHLHEVHSLNSITPAHNCCIFNAKALYDGKDNNEGFNYYTIDIQANAVSAFYRRFIRKRTDYDLDTEHARGGAATFQLPARARPGHELVVAYRCSLASSKLEQQLHDELRAFQQLDQPIYVTPRIVRGAASPANAKATAMSVDPLKLGGSDSILFGQTEMGKTIFLKRLAHEHNQQARSPNGRLALYVDFRTAPAIGTETELMLFLKASSVGVFDELPSNLWLIVDHIEKQPSAMPEILSKVAKNSGWLLLVSTSNAFFKTTLLASQEFSRFSAYEITEWGPSRIREFLSSFSLGVNGV